MTVGFCLLRLRARAMCLLVSAAAISLTGCSALVPKPDATLLPADRLQSQAEQEARAAAQSLLDFSKLQMDQAEQAERQGHWTKAAWHWEALVALRPQDPNSTARHQRALQAADSLAALRLSQARLALQLGDADSARELLVRALAAQPALPEAAESLRSIERERMRQQSAKVVSRHQPSRQARLPIAFAHAQLLALQGELEGAIALLRPLAEAQPPDRSARRRLADLLLQLGQLQYAEDPVAAARTVRSSLRLDPDLAAARNTLRDWQRTAAKR